LYFITSKNTEDIKFTKEVKPNIFFRFANFSIF
jgi:hypothetical protein